jgi:predicted nucleic acid-binding protein
MILFMRSDIFLDTSGIYAYLVKQDEKHTAAASSIQEALKADGRLITTDYIIDEISTLMKARGHGHIITKIFDGILSSRACHIEWMDQELFDKTKTLFLKHIDQHWSFTDCFSFVVMKQLGIKKALTKDAHFLEAGFIPLLIEK